MIDEYGLNYSCNLRVDILDALYLLAYGANEQLNAISTRIVIINKKRARLNKK